MEIVWSGFQSMYVNGHICVMFWKFISDIRSCHSIAVPNIEFQAISRWFGLGLILVRKRIDLRYVLEVHFGRKGFGYLEISERPVNLYSVLS